MGPLDSDDAAALCPGPYPGGRAFQAVVGGPRYRGKADGSPKRKEGGAERVTDEEYYRRYLGGDETGLTALMDRYGDALTLYIDGYLGDIHEAEDLMIETFSYLLTKRPRIRDGGLKAYLYKSARHMALRHKSKWRAVFSLEELAEEPEAETLIEEVVKDRERSRILHLCMERLHAEYREVLYLTYFEGLSYAEAAEVMGKSVKQITNMVYRGKQSLRELLEKEGITHAE